MKGQVRECNISAMPPKDIHSQFWGISMNDDDDDDESGSGDDDSCSGGGGGDGCDDHFGSEDEGHRRPK